MKILAVLLLAVALSAAAAVDAFAQRGLAKGGIGGLDQGLGYDSQGRFRRLPIRQTTQTVRVKKNEAARGRKRRVQ